MSNDEIKQIIEELHIVALPIIFNREPNDNLKNYLTAFGYERAEFDAKTLMTAAESRHYVWTVKTNSDIDIAVFERCYNLSLEAQ